MSRSKQRGTSWESKLVGYLQSTHWPLVERRTLSGRYDKGDIAGIPGVVVEAKDQQTLRIPEWWRETLVEAENAGADIAALWVKRRGFTSPADGYVVISGETFVELLHEAGW